MLETKVQPFPLNAVALKEKKNTLCKNSV